MTISRLLLPLRTGLTQTRLSSSHATAAAITGPARTRFAPSPTGFLHLGSLRTALFNYLLAKGTGGQFLLRIEDTDQKRTVAGAEASLFETLRWAGLQWDEGPEVGGPYGSYRQSERSELHRQHARLLIDGGHAYRCFCPTERLQALAVTRKRAGLPTDYDRTCASIKADESASRAAAGEAHVVRLRVPDQYPAFNDTVYGHIAFTENARAHSLGSYEDPILLKSDGLPTYHLANVVDDHHMKITHVCRATEWLPSTPKHVHLYNCFGWTPPQFVHVGLLQNSERGKLSKRNGDVFVSEYRERGYLPESLNNFVALLGWSHERTSDVMSLEDMVKSFNTARLTPGNTIVNFEKLDFLQKHHVRARAEAGSAEEQELFETVVKGVATQYGETLETGDQITKDYIYCVFRANIQNYLLPDTFVKSSSYFFRAPEGFAPKPVRQVKKYLTENNLTYDDLMGGFVGELEKCSEEDWNVDRLHGIVEIKTGEDRSRWTSEMRVVRLALTGGEPGPSVAETMAVLGRDRTMLRLEKIKASDMWK